jgi:hypothetical protein
MEAIRRAFDEVHHNLGSLLLYIALTALPASVWLFVDFLVIGEAQPRDDGPYLGIQLLVLVGISLVAAVGQSVAFSRMGREIDKPLWKVKDDGDALRRFFAMWLTLDLMVVLVAVVVPQMLLQDPSEDALVMYALLRLIVQALMVPVGAAFMFFGNFSLRMAGAALAPLGREFGQLLLILLLNGLALLFLDGLFTVLAEGALPLGPVAVPLRLATYPLVYVVSSYVDCVVFAATWLLCMADRDREEEIDFDI